MCKRPKHHSQRKNTTWEGPKTRDFVVHAKRFGMMRGKGAAHARPGWRTGQYLAGRMKT